jgi:hypothetical protein
MFETDDALRVVVFESADPNFFVNHYDVSRAAETPVAPGPTGPPTFIDTTVRLATTSVVTMAKIRGRAEGEERRRRSPSTCDSPAQRRLCSGNQRSVQACSPEAAPLSDSPGRTGPCALRSTKIEVPRWGRGPARELRRATAPTGLPVGSSGWQISVDTFGLKRCPRRNRQCRKNERRTAGSAWPQRRQ